MKHLVRCILMHPIELFIPTGKVNERTKLPRWKLPDDPLKEMEKLFKRYRKMHPKRRHMRFDIDGSAPFYQWLNDETEDLCDRLYAEPLGEYEVGPSAGHDSEGNYSHKEIARKRLCKGQDAMPPPTDLMKQCWAHVDTYPDSNSAGETESEPECELDEDDPCKVCFPDRVLNEEADSEVDSEPASVGDPVNESVMINDHVKINIVKLKPERLDQPTANVGSESDNREPLRKKPKFEQRQCEQRQSEFKFCQHHQPTWGQTTAHLKEFDAFVEDCAAVDRSSNECTRAGSLWKAYGIWSSAKKRPWNVPQRYFYKCAQMKFCVKKPKGMMTFYGVRLYGA